MPLLSRRDSDSIFGVYYYKDTRWGAFTFAIVFVVSGPILAVVAKDLLTAHSTVLLQLLLVIGASAMWLLYSRPCFIVSSSGVTIVDALSTRSFTWLEIDRFDADLYLRLTDQSGKTFTVLSLPAVGIRRVLLGREGPVDRLARRLNGYRASLHGSTRAAEPISLETPQGRRDVVILAGVSLLSSLIVTVAKYDLYF